MRTLRELSAECETDSTPQHPELKLLMYGCRSAAASSASTGACPYTDPRNYAPPHFSLRRHIKRPKGHPRPSSSAEIGRKDYREAIFSAWRFERLRLVRCTDRYVGFCAPAWSCLAFVPAPACPLLEFSLFASDHRSDADLLLRNYKH